MVQEAKRAIREGVARHEYVDLRKESHKEGTGRDRRIPIPPAGTYEVIRGGRA